MGDEFDDLDLELEEEAPPEPPRTRQTRRMVLGETSITAGEPTRYDETGEGVEMGPEVDADAPIAPAPKAPPTGPTDQQREWWEERETERELGETSTAGDVGRAALGAIPGLGGFVGSDESAGRLTRRGLAAGEEWLANVGEGMRGAFGDTPVLEDLVGMIPEDAGARPPDRQITGRDRRAEAPIAGFADTATLGWDDELAGIASTASGGDYEATRDRVRGMSDDAQAQAPGSFAIGQAAGTAPWLAAPNPATGGGRVALNALLGGLDAAGHSDETGMALAGDTALGAGFGAGAGVLGEAATGAPRRMAGALELGAERAQQGADQALLEATGFWGNRAIDQIDRAGGPASVAADLRRFNIGRGGGQRIPRMQQAADDLAALGRGGGNTMGLIAETADEAGARVPTSSIIERAEQEARRLEQLGTATAQRAAERIRGEVAPLAARGDVPLSDAWSLRRHFDSMADFSGGAGADDVARTAGEQFRSLRRGVDSEMDSALAGVGLGRQWDEASRMAQLGILSDRAGAGHRRLSVGGGMGGATSSGDLVADAVTSGNPLRVLAAVPQTVAARAMGQEARMVAPGAIAMGRQLGADTRRGAARQLRGLSRHFPDLTPAQAEALQRMLRVGGAQGADEVAVDDPMPAEPPTAPTEAAPADTNEADPLDAFGDLDIEFEEMPQ